MASQRVESRADLGMRRSIKKQNGFSTPTTCSRIRTASGLSTGGTYRVVTDIERRAKNRESDAGAKDY